MDRGLLVHDRPGARPPGGGPFQRAKHGSKVHVTLGTMLEVLRQGGRGYGKVKPLLLQRIAQLQLMGEQRRAESQRRNCRSCSPQPDSWGTPTS